MNGRAHGDPGAPDDTDDPDELEQPDVHPNTPSRPVVLLALVGLAFAGALGGVIGWGIVDSICAEDPTLLQQLLRGIDGYHSRVPSCDPYRLGGSLAGATVAAVGTGVVIVLLLRSMSEWRPHHPTSTGLAAQPPNTTRRKPSA